MHYHVPPSQRVIKRDEVTTVNLFVTDFEMLLHEEFRPDLELSWRGTNLASTKILEMVAV